MLPIRAKVFWSGPSQAVRLPKAFRFTTDEVTIRKVGDALVLEPALRRGWPVGYAASFADLPEDFERPEPLPGSDLRPPGSAPGGAVNYLLEILRIEGWLWMIGRSCRPAERLTRTDLSGRWGLVGHRAGGDACRRKPQRSDTGFSGVQSMGRPQPSITDRR
jgi:antitoxin VapB